MDIHIIRLFYCNSRQQLLWCAVIATGVNQIYHRKGFNSHITISLESPLKAVSSALYYSES